MKLTGLLLFFILTSYSSYAQWQPASNRIKTKWAEEKMKEAYQSVIEMLNNQ